MAIRDDLLAIPDAVLRRGDVTSAILVFMDFRDNPKRWWTGFGPLQQAGYTWQGTGDVVTISDIPAPFDLSAEPVIFEMAPTAEMVLATMNQRTQVKGRQVVIYDQFFAVTPQGAIGPWQPMLAPIVSFVGTMEQLEFSASGPGERRLTLTCEGQFVRRNAPPRGRLTDRDQRARHPGDKGLERVALHKDHETSWS